MSCDRPEKVVLRTFPVDGSGEADLFRPHQLVLVWTWPADRRQARDPAMRDSVLQNSRENRQPLSPIDRHLGISKRYGSPFPSIFAMQNSVDNWTGRLRWMPIDNEK